MKASDILRELVAIPSVSHESNEPLVSYISNHFASIDWHCRSFSYTDPQGIKKYNLLCSPQPFAEGCLNAELAIVCHTDTVPSGEWQDATTLREKDGLLHGRGACDVKGFLACMLVAAFGIRPSTLSKRLCMVFTSDEEIGCKGARFLYQRNALHARYAIVGEPTSLLPARAGKGYCLAEVHIYGTAAHSAYPEQGRSAIMSAARLLRRIEELSKELEVDRNEAFSPAWTTINVGTIHGGSAKNIVPEHCSFLVEWRPIPNQSPELVYERLKECAVSETSKGMRLEIELLRLEPGFETSAESQVIKGLCEGRMSNAQTVSFGTEAPWLARMGAETVVFGPGSMLTAHSARECVPMKELDDCVSILSTAIASLCN